MYLYFERINLVSVLAILGDGPSLEGRDTDTRY